MQSATAHHRAPTIREYRGPDGRPPRRTGVRRGGRGAERSGQQKLLVLHQFRLDMLPGRERVDLSRDELAVMVHADGQGGQGDKQATWAALRQGAPEDLWWGWKNFYDEDLPMLTPEQTAEQVRPQPQLISYQ